MNTFNLYGYSDNQQTTKGNRLRNEARRVFAYAVIRLGLGLVGENWND